MELSSESGSLSASLLSDLRRIVGKENVETDLPNRLVHSRDMWPPTVLWTSRGHFPYLPQAIVSPVNSGEISELLEWASRKGVSVVPFGGGSGVCGGALPLKGGIVISMKRMDQLVSIDAESLIAEIEPGIYGETLERQLNPLGYTMGHFPSSIYCSTLGGYLAARSAGQMSSRYGKIEDMVAAIEFVLPDGSIHRTVETPMGTGRPDWAQILIGSEGTLGIITRAWMRIHPIPRHRCFASYNFSSVDAGIAAMRKIMQAGLEPAVLRLYDEFDTLVAGSHGPSTDGQAKAGGIVGGLSQKFSEMAETMKKRSLSPALKQATWLNRAVSMLPGKCLLVILTEGERDMADFEINHVHRICKNSRGDDSGEGPARYWLEHRYAISYKQSKIFDAGGWVDTMEVATTFDNIINLYDGVRLAVGDDVFIMAHFSHAYPDGCCIYFSMAGSGGTQEQMERQHARMWSRALATVRAHDATITHHHGVGYSKGPMMPAEYGALWTQFTAIKQTIDPKNVMNPGKLGLEV